MNFIKENKIIIIPIIVLVIAFGILLARFMFPEEEVIENTSLGVNHISQPKKKVTGEAQNDVVSEDSNGDIDMSKYYLTGNNQEVAKVYNAMLDRLGKQKFIVETTTETDCIKTTIDLDKMCFKSEYDEFYECWAYSTGRQRKYKYYYGSGESEFENEESLYMKTKADFVDFAVDFAITDNSYEWYYEINENVERNGHNCYEIIATWNGDYITATTNEAVRNDGIDKLYIDMETYELVERENTFYLNDTVGYTGFSEFYEYTEGSLELSEEAENLIFN